MPKSKPQTGPLETCARCGRKSRLGTEVSFYLTYKGTEALCVPAVRNCAAEQYREQRREYEGSRPES